MNYQAAAALTGGGALLSGAFLPVGDNWARLTYALAGYGRVVGGPLVSVAPVVCESSVARTCTATSSIEVV